MELETIISLNEKLIYKIAKKFYDVPTEDLYQAGVIGIIKAYNNYKPNENTKFTTYAFNYIYGEMYELANSVRSIKLSKDILRLYKKIEQTKYLLAQSMNRIPTTKEVAKYLEIDELLIEQIINSTNTIMSIDEEENRVFETLSSETKVPLSSIIDIKDSLETLDDKEKEIIKYRYFKDYTQSETAKILGMSQVTVSRYEKKSLNKMYNYLNI